MNLQLLGQLHLLMIHLLKIRWRSVLFAEYPVLFAEDPVLFAPDPSYSMKILFRNTSCSAPTYLPLLDQMHLLMIHLLKIHRRHMSCFPRMDLSMLDQMQLLMIHPLKIPS